MAGTFTPGALGAGTLITTPDAIYAVPASAAAYVRNFWVANSGTEEETILLYLVIAGVTRFWRSLVLEEGESANILEDENALILEGGHQIVASTTTAGVVTYQLSGVVET